MKARLSAIKYILSRPFVFLVAFPAAVAVSVMVAIYGRGDAQPVTDEIINMGDEFFVKFDLTVAAGTPVLYYQGYPFRGGLFLNDDMSTEGAWETVRHTHIERRVVELGRHRPFRLVVDTFRLFAFARNFEQESKRSKAAWFDKWDTRNTELVMAWLDAGGDVNTPSRGWEQSDGMTLYFLADYFGYAKLKQLLILRGANPTAYTRQPVAARIDIANTSASS
jgi:hypothetical protein